MKCLVIHVNKSHKKVTSSAIRKTVQRLMKDFQKNPENFAAAVDHILKKPRVHLERKQHWKEKILSLKGKVNA